MCIVAWKRHAMRRYRTDVTILIAVCCTNCPSLTRGVHQRYTGEPPEPPGGVAGPRREDSRRSLNHIGSMKEKKCPVVVNVSSLCECLM